MVLFSHVNISVFITIQSKLAMTNEVDQNCTYNADRVFGYAYSKHMNYILCDMSELEWKRGGYLH